MCPFAYLFLLFQIRLINPPSSFSFPLSLSLLLCALKSTKHCPSIFFQSFSSSSPLTTNRQCLLITVRFILLCVNHPPLLSQSLLFSSSCAVWFVCLSSRRTCRRVLPVLFFSNKIRSSTPVCFDYGRQCVCVCVSACFLICKTVFFRPLESWHEMISADSFSFLIIYCPALEKQHNRTVCLSWFDYNRSCLKCLHQLNDISIVAKFNANNQFSKLHICSPPRHFWKTLVFWSLEDFDGFELNPH